MPHSIRSPQHPLPLAAERGAEAQERRHEDGDVAGFDLLHGARVQVSEFGQPLLRQRARHPLAAEIVAESLPRTRFGGASGHRKRARSRPAQRAADRLRVKSFQSYAETVGELDEFASPTQRVRPSILAIVSRPMSQPITWHFPARAGCESPHSPKSCLRECRIADTLLL